ncbi:Na+/H+ antiporter [Nocardioides sp. GY 10113]|uniref:Na+/H+ antiporter n=1 Tax=Nocardioides sp. GY 10113 TaxID=2569761 RepID=UPI0010A80B16|nr:Na+/H+ antiporter [Nocardioides sp. GY 10113]TIC89266.1 Na+/H+ antiporter [Nocardioides sp. GY 10113]
MEIALLLVAIAVTVLTVTAVSERYRVPAPLTLIVAGVAASYVPGLPEVRLEPEIVLLGLLPPLLYSAALTTSLVDFNANRRPILLLSVGLIVFTTAGVALVVHAVVPDMGWPLAFAIGAVVAPPDAVAATAIGRRIGLPRRVVTILEGESLLNDATALVALRTAVAALGTTVTALEVGVDFVVAAGGGVAVGALTFLVVAFVRKRLSDPLLDTAISLVVPFASYLVAEEIHASGVVAVVIAGLLLGHQAPVLQTARSRLAERTNWRTIAYVLENTVFLLIGLQADWMVEEVRASELSGAMVAGASLVTLAAVVLLRLVWVFSTRFLLERNVGGTASTWRHTLLIGWAGMRGVVTLAAAFVVPEDTPYRELVLVIAFTVVAGTLFGQGSTLPWLARRLKVPGPDPMEDALARATLLQQAAKAGKIRLMELTGSDPDSEDDPYGVRATLVDRVEQRNFAAWERLGTTPGEESPSASYNRLRTEMIAAERRRVLEIRSDGRVASEVVSEVLALLDVEESMLDLAEADRAGVEAGALERQVGEQCAHLEQAEVLPAPDVPEGEGLVCAACVAIGSRWVALRMCLECGEVGCCDSSPNRHATAHFRETAHPVMRSVEPGESWRWCFVHHLTG